MNKKSGVLILLIMSVAVNALAVDYPKPTSWVNDYAGVLSSDQQQELDSMLKDFETATTNQIFICIMETLPADISLEEYVNELFERWQPGQKDKDNGVLLAIFINDRKLRIEVGYGLEDKLTDADSKLIIANEIAPGFKQGNYYQGIKNGIDKMMLTIKGDYKPQAKKVQPSKPPSRRTRKGSDGPPMFALIAIIWIIFVFIMILRNVFGSSGGWSYGSSSGWNHSGRRSRKSSSSFSFSFGGGSSSSSSSSFSFGSSSSGSSGSSRRSTSGFSGGGGGSSGGGGASGSW
jgi:uncharacterized protein